MFLSYSKLKTFRECRLRYRLQYVNRLPQAPHGYARLGQRVHATIRRAYQYASQGKFSREQLQKHYEDVCDVVRQPEVAQSREFGTGRTILENFYRTVEGIPARPVMLEQRFKVEIGEHLLTGQLDRVDLREDTGGYEILDYKMGKAMLSPAEVARDLQLGLYGLGGGNDSRQIRHKGSAGEPNPRPVSGVFSKTSVFERGDFTSENPFPKAFFVSQNPSQNQILKTCPLFSF